MKLTVVIPSYKRPLDLERCLAGLDGQKQAPDEVIVVYRDEDVQTEEFLQQWEQQETSYRKKRVQVCVPGVIQAMSAGIAQAEGDITAFIDDDAVPWPDWVEKLKKYYRDPQVGGVGGRDVMEGADRRRKQSVVGQVTWYGKLIGNHDQGFGEAREADVLKGVNMSFRTGLIQFPDFMKGRGAQVHFEVYVCMRIRKLGYKLIYDPELRVYHYPAPRHDIDQRNAVVRDAVTNASFNLSVALLHGLSSYKRPARVVYATLVGDRRAPGLIRFLAGAASNDRAVVQSFIPAQKGLMNGLLYYIRNSGPGAGGTLEVKGGRQT